MAQLDRPFVNLWTGTTNVDLVGDYVTLFVEDADTDSPTYSVVDNSEDATPLWEPDAMQAQTLMEAFGAFIELETEAVDEAQADDASFLAYAEEYTGG